MDLDSDPIAHLELVHGWAKPHYCAHVLVPGREAFVERQIAIDHCRDPVAHDFDVSRAHRDSIDANQHFRCCRFRDWLFD
jgi:hypothetical protein